MTAMCERSIREMAERRAAKRRAADREYIEYRKALTEKHRRRRHKKS